MSLRARRLPLASVTPGRLLVAVALTTFVVELLLVDRKYGLFTGGFGSSKIVDTPREWLLLLCGAVLVHALWYWLVWRVLCALHRSRPRGLVLRHNILWLAGGGFLAALIAKFEVLSYFSDAIGYSLIKSLGGGSLKEALLFGLYYAGDITIVGGLVVLTYALGLWWARSRDPRVPAPARPPLHVGAIATLAVVVVAVLFGVNRVADVRYANMRFLAYSMVVTALDQATDFDRDGYSWFSEQRDGAPLDPSRHPYALDIPDNGVDEDEVGGDLRLGALPAPLPPLKFTGARPHFVHVVFESARRELIGKEIDGKLVAPNLTALARQGSYAPAISPVGFTTESLKAMFTGYEGPPRHSESLFTDFKANGYRIGVFSGQAEHFGDIAETVSLTQTADVFIDAEHLKDERVYGYASRASIKVDEMVVLREFDKAFGEAAAWAQPTFLYFNFQSAHFPYWHPGMKSLVLDQPIPRSEVRAANQPWVSATYWNALAYADYALGELIGRLKTLGVWDNTVLVVTGDHGEELFEDGFLGHGHIIKTLQYGTFFVASRPGYGSATPVGLTDYRAMVRAVVTGSPPVSRTAPVLMHIGPLDGPEAIGMVDAHQQFTILHLDSKEVQLGEYAARRPYDGLAGPDRDRVDALIRLWGEERWKHHLLQQARK